MGQGALTAAVIGAIAIVCLVTRLLGNAARKLGQPAVIGWIVAGILLGPSLLGRLPGNLTAHLFPAAALPYLSLLSQVAIVVFMFIVGYEFSLGLLRGHKVAVPLIALSAFSLPLLLGFGTAAASWRYFGSLAGSHSSERLFIIFMGVALSITALPVLAAIVRERGLAGTMVGAVATGAAGAMDLIAWLVLAAALVTTQHGTGLGWPQATLIAVGFVVAMLFVVRPALKFLMGRPGSVLSNQVPVAFLLAMGSAWVTASLGIHPVFGGFLAGLAMPRLNGSQDADVVRSMNELGDFLLPLFFAVTGLSVNISALQSSDYIVLVIIIVVASAGKLGPAYAGARLSGLKPQQSASVAALINTRGLTELIVLNIGLTAQIISQAMFTILVLMALVTTFATAPLLAVIDGRRSRTEEIARQRKVTARSATRTDAAELAAQPGDLAGKEAAETAELQEGDQ